MNNQLIQKKVGKEKKQQKGQIENTNGQKT